MAPGARPSPGPGRAPRLIANPWARVPIGSGTCRPRPLTCPAARPPSGRLAASPGPPPAELSRTTWWGLFGKRGRLRSRWDDKESFLLPVPASPLFYFGGGGGEKGWKDADMGKTNSPSTPSGLCSSKEGLHRGVSPCRLWAKPAGVGHGESHPPPWLERSTVGVGYRAQSSLSKGQSRLTAPPQTSARHSPGAQGDPEPSRGTQL